MRLKSLKKLTSEIPGQSRHALPLPNVAFRATSGNDEVTPGFAFSQKFDRGPFDLFIGSYQLTGFFRRFLLRAYWL